MDGMSIRAILWSLLLLAGCGGPAIITASRHIAELRGCEPADLTLEATGASFVAAGCGEPGTYRCTDSACEESADDVAMDADRVADVRRQLEALDAEIAECASGAEAPVIQVYFDRGGRPQGLALHPQGDAEVRGCIGALVLDHVVASAGSELLVAYPDGETAAEPAAAAPDPEATPSAVEPPAVEPVAPARGPPETEPDDEALP